MTLLNRTEVRKKIKRDLREIFEEYVPETMSNFDKRKVVYDYMVNNFEYNTYLYDTIIYRMKHKDGTYRPHRATELADTVFNHRGISHSLAQYYKLALEDLGIPTYYVTYMGKDGIIRGLNLVYDKNNSKYPFSFDDVALGIINKDSTKYFNYDLKKANYFDQGTERINGSLFWHIADETYINIYLHEVGRPRKYSDINGVLDFQKKYANGFLLDNKSAIDYVDEPDVYVKRKGRR